MRVPGQFTGRDSRFARDLIWKEAGIVVSAVSDTTPTHHPTMVSPLDRKSYRVSVRELYARVRHSWSRSSLWEQAVRVRVYVLLSACPRYVYRAICMRVIILSDMHMVARGKTLYRVCRIVEPFSFVLVILLGGLLYLVFSDYRMFRSKLHRC